MDAIDERLQSEVHYDNYVKKIINKPIEVVDRINPLSIMSLRQRLKPQEDLTIKNTDEE